eukprot:scaffold145_cov195-Alexandrium_tamarense.AAC.28
MIVLPGNRCCLAKGVRVLVSSTSRTVNNAVVDETSNLRGSISVQPISEAARKKRLRTHKVQVHTTELYDA